MTLMPHPTPPMTHSTTLMPQPIGNSVALNSLVPLEVQQTLGVLIAGGVAILDCQDVSNSSINDVRIASEGLLQRFQERGSSKSHILIYILKEA